MYLHFSLNKKKKLHFKGHFVKFLSIFSWFSPFLQYFLLWLKKKSKKEDHFFAWESDQYTYLLRSFFIRTTFLGQNLVHSILKVLRAKWFLFWLAKIRNIVLVTNRSESYLFLIVAYFRLFRLILGLFGPILASFS